MTTTKFKTIDEIYSDIKQNILSMDYYDLIILHNEYCNKIYSYDSCFFLNDPETINEIFVNSYDALRSMFYGDYNPNHEFFTFDGYGNLQSFPDYSTKLYMDIDKIIYSIFEDPYNYTDIVHFLSSEYIESIEALKESN